MARKTTVLTVIRSERLTPHMVRVTFGDPGFDDFDASEFTDSYVKIHFGGEGDPTLRTYTVRSVDPEAREVAIDFVVHGDSGVAGPWARSVEPGTAVTFYGPNGAYSPRDDADWHLLAGDESAVPAISAALAKMPPNAVAKVFIEVAGSEDELPLTAPAGADITWLHRGSSSDSVTDELAGDSAPLVAAVREAEWLPGKVQVFVHGEASAVMHNIRGYVRKDRGVPAEWASISGYWRRGRTEEGFREWKRELAAKEA